MRNQVNGRGFCHGKLFDGKTLELFGYSLIDIVNYLVHHKFSRKVVEIGGVYLIGCANCIENFFYFGRIQGPTGQISWGIRCGTRQNAIVLQGLDDGLEKIGWHREQ